VENIGEYKIETFPISRISTIDIGIAGLKKHHIKALIELDVTEARKMIREKKKLSEKISFNSWLIKCISHAVEESPQIHGIRKGKRKVAIFDDIDISIVIEREIQGEKVPLPYVIRKTNEKSISDICNEIRNGQKQSIKDEGDYILGEKKNDLLMKFYYTMPGFIRRIIWRNIIRSPFLTKQNMGTVIITSVGMMGKINGWVIPVSVHPLCFAIGSIVKKPGVIDDRIEVREYLYITVLVDHDIIDGAPAVRALSKLTKLVESGFGLS
jgi:pyruvate/2-oxoglutarate dehydrogenase complex dihydrolipoamide acyltransferase (E2) component